MSRRERLRAPSSALLVALTTLALPASALAAITPTDDAHAIAGAIMTAPAQLTGASWHQRPLNIDPSATATSFGTQPAASAFPSDGDSFAILSSGNARSADDADVGPEVTASGWGADRGDSHDVSALRLDVNVPAKANCLSLDFAFLSEEYPDYVGEYNDAFVAELDTSDWSASGVEVSAPHNFAFDDDGDVASINAGGVAAVSLEAADGTTYNAATARITASTPITPGSHRIYLSISDNGDWALDSAAFVDNLRIGAVANPLVNCRPGARPAPPHFTQSGPPSATGREGSTLSTSGAFAADGATPLVLAISPNPGRFVAHADGSWTWSLLATDDVALGGITVSATGGFGFAAAETFDAIATNVAPAVTLSAFNDTIVDEGPAEHVVRYSITDPGTDAISSVETSCGPGTKVLGSDHHTTTEGSLRCRFADGPAAALVTVRATDDDGGVSELASQLVTVRNVAPSVALTSAQTEFEEGAVQRTFEYSIADPGRDKVAAVTTGCGEGAVKVPGSSQHTDGGGSFACVFADGPATPMVTVAAEDSDRATGVADSRAVIVHNVAPEVSLQGGDERVVDEGSAERSFEYTIADPGRDGVTAVTACGDGGEKVAQSDAGGEAGGSFRCVFADGPATSAVTVVATDSDGATGPSDRREVTVEDVAPTVTLDAANPLSVTESRDAHPYRYEISDPGIDTITSVTTSCGTAGAKLPGSDAHDATSGRLSCVFANGPAAAELSVRATDSDDRTGAAATQTVAVADPPIAAQGVDVAGVETAEIAGAVARFTDPTPYATAGEYRATIDWGDGSPSSAATIAKLDGGDFAVRGAHAYGRFGTYAVTVRVADEDNAANTDVARATATVADAPIRAAAAPITTPLELSGRVASFTDDADPDGPPADFSATIDWGDGSEPTAGAITAADASGRFGVSGSHTYAATGRYTVTVIVRSAGASSDSATSPALVYAFATATGGSFAISDGAGPAVTFWSGQWQDANPFVSGASAGSFKGYVDPPASLTPRTCGQSWRGRNGGGATPPSTLPAYMAVLVSGPMDKSGSTVGGDVVRVVVVETDAGYAGTGTVVGTVCG